MKILYIISGETGFKKNDERILNSFAKVRKINYKRFLDYLDPRLVIKLIWCDCVLIWFASKHAIPVILLNIFFKKPIFIIAGGWDVANVPEIKYGAMNGKLRQKIGIWILNRADKVISVSKSNMQEILFNTKISERKVRLIYNCVKIRNYTPLKKKTQILTVGELNEETYLRKGIDHYINLAKLLPGVQFFHIGKWTNKKGRTSKIFAEKIINSSPKNLTFLGFLSELELEKFYKESKVYIQLSRHEAFGVSVVEAMQMGCIPIVSNNYALPEIVGNPEYVIDDCYDYKYIVKKIRFYLYNDLNLGFKIDQFNFSKREKEFKLLFSDNI